METLNSNVKEESDGFVRVSVRVRPLVSEEIVQTCGECVSVSGKQVIIGQGSDRAFSFDEVFIPQDTQKSIYERTVAPLVCAFFDGYNSTVLAYGQTGSGKTFTMGSGFSLSTAESDYGIIPRVLKEIFHEIENRQASSFLLNVSYLEIHNEDIRDLLSNDNEKSKSLSIREASDKGITVVGLTELKVSSIDEILECLKRGSLGRATASTSMNLQSSRSHAIFSISMEQTRNDGDYRYSKFHLVDLAGSERIKRTRAEGERLKEGININKGLLALGNVISSLTCERRTAESHIPYRDSKLTRLLQDSLGGNSRTAMIACISPADINYDETLNTLRYANRAKNIKNKAIVNRDPHAVELSQLRQQIHLLQLQLVQSKIHGGNMGLKDNDIQNLVQNLEIAENLAEDRGEELIHMKSLKGKWKKIVKRMVQINQDHIPVEIQEEIKSLDLLDDTENSVALENTNPSCPTGSPPKSDTSQLIDNLNKLIQEKEKAMDSIAGELKVSCQYEEKIKSLEYLVSKLEEEKCTLKKSQHVAFAEDHKRKLISKDNKIKDLVKQIQHFKEKQKQLQMDVKSKNIKDQRLSSLEREIQDMKQQKVALQRMYREECGEHRKEKRKQEHEISQLKRREQKQQYQMKKMEELMLKQKIILKRRSEESLMAQKKQRRLEEKKSTVQKQQAGHRGNHLPMDLVEHWEQELEVKVTILQVKRALKSEFESRKKLSMELKKATNNTMRSSIQQKISELNEHIQDMTQKLSSVEEGQQNSSLSFLRQPTSLADAVESIKILYKHTIEGRMKCFDYDMLESQFKELENELFLKNEAFVRQQHEFDAKLAERTLENNQRVLETEETKVLQQKLEQFKKQLDQIQLEKLEQEKLEKEKMEKKAKRLLEKKRESHVSLSDISFSGSESDLVSDDSDYRETPEKQKKQRKKKKQVDTSNDKIVLDEIDALLDGECCQCKGKCARGSCSCRANGAYCGEKCKCKEAKCVNRLNQNSLQLHKENRGLTGLFVDFKNEDHPIKEVHDPKKRKILGEVDSNIVVSTTTTSKVKNPLYTENKKLRLSNSSENKKSCFSSY